MTTNLFVIANVKQLWTGGSFRILLSFFQTSCDVGVPNSAICNSFHSRVQILEGLRNFGGGGVEPPLGTPLRTLLFHDRGTRRGDWWPSRAGRTLPPGKTRYPLYRNLGGPQGWSGRAEYLVATGIRSRTVQPVAQSLYRLSYRAHFNWPLRLANINICYISERTVFCCAVNTQ